MNNLAGAYERADRVTEALKLFTETLEIEERTLGPDHVQTLTTMSNLGMAYESAGQLSEAMALLEKTLGLTKQ